MGDSAENRGSDGTPRPLVLVVDDDKAITRMLDLMLRRMLDVDVQVAHVGFGVLNIIAAKRPSVVLLDVMMPGLDGQALTKLIRGDADLAGTRVVLYSAMDEGALVALKNDCGADDYMPKALRPTEVARRLGRWLPSAARRSSVPAAK